MNELFRITRTTGGGVGEREREREKKLAKAEHAEEALLHTSADAARRILMHWDSGAFSGVIMIATTQQNMTTELVCYSFLVFCLFVCCFSPPALPYVHLRVCVQPPWGLWGDSIHRQWGIPHHRLLLCPFIPFRLDCQYCGQTWLVHCGAHQCGASLNADLKSTSHSEHNWPQRAVPRTCTVTSVLKSTCTAWLIIPAVQVYCKLVDTTSTSTSQHQLFLHKPTRDSIWWHALPTAAVAYGVFTSLFSIDFKLIWIP